MLTDRQIRVVGLIADGNTRDDIAEALGVSPGSVRRIVRKLCRRYGCGMVGLPAAVINEQIDYPYGRGLV